MRKTNPMYEKLKKEKQELEKEFAEYKNMGKYNRERSEQKISELEKELLEAKAYIKVHQGTMQNHIEEINWLRKTLELLTIDGTKLQQLRQDDLVD